MRTCTCMRTYFQTMPIPTLLTDLYFASITKSVNVFLAPLAPSPGEDSKELVLADHWSAMGAPEKQQAMATTTAAASATPQHVDLLQVSRAYE
jgi:hypothetical protein